MGHYSQEPVAPDPNLKGRKTKKGHGQISSRSHRRSVCGGGRLSLSRKREDRHPGVPDLRGSCPETKRTGLRLCFLGHRVEKGPSRTVPRVPTDQDLLRCPGGTSECPGTAPRERHSLSDHYYPFVVGDPRAFLLSHTAFFLDRKDSRRRR